MSQDVGIELRPGLFTWISASDADAIARYRWFARPRDASNGGHYAYRSAGGRSIYLHRVILGAGPGQIVDHIDGDGLNNRRANLRANLRIADASLNLANRRGYSPASGYRGVYTQASGRYAARVQFRGIVHHGGTHDTAAQAARRYDEIASKLFGEFAALNFPGMEAA